MNLVWRTVEKSPTVLGSSASSSPGTLKAQSRTFGLIASAGRPAARNSNEDAASSSEAWQSDVNPNSSTERPAATGKTQRVIDKDRPNNFDEFATTKLVAGESVSHIAASSPTAPSSGASSRPGILRPSQQGSNLIAQNAGRPAIGGSNQNDAASSLKCV